jgi:hypothetical protein
LCSDGENWWVKAPGNPQGVRTLAAEVVVSGVGELIGAPVRPTCLVEIPSLFDWRYTAQDRLRGGIGHGSRHVDSAIVSDEWLTYSRHDDNHARQARLLGLWDLCMGGDAQWLHDPIEDFTVWSFDHGFWLGGDGYWDGDSVRSIGDREWTYDLDPTVTSRSALEAVADEIEGLDSASIRSVVERVPVEWSIDSSDLTALANVLAVRTEGVALRLRAAARTTSFA